MSIAILALATGREDYLARTLASVEQHLHGPVTERWIYTEVDGVADAHPGYERIGASGPLRGLAAAHGDAWRILLARSQADYVFHLEEDFVLLRDLDLAQVCTVMATRPYLVQMALRRQPWNADEARAGGIVEQHPGDYADATDGVHDWLEHRRFFTTNPCVYRHELMYRGWPQLAGHFAPEGTFGIDLFAEAPELRAGYWGHRLGGIWVEHIGHIGAPRG